MTPRLSVSTPELSHVPGELTHSTAELTHATPELIHSPAELTFFRADDPRFLGGCLAFRARQRASMTSVLPFRHLCSSVRPSGIYVEGAA